MNQTNLLQKLAPLGVAVFGAISFTGIAVVSAQAAVFTQASSLQWTGSVSDFVKDAGIAIEDKTSFTVTFNPSEESSVNGISGDFVPYFPDLDLPNNFAAGGSTVTFNFVRETETILGFETSADFEIEDDLTFSFLTSATPGSPVTLTLPRGSIFTASLDTNGAVEVRLDSGGWKAVLPNAPDGDPDISGIANSSTLTFDQSDGSIIGVYSTTGSFNSPDTTIPESASILGILAIGGLGLGLKHKKQA